MRGFCFPALLCMLLGTRSFQAHFFSRCRLIEHPLVPPKRFLAYAVRPRVPVMASENLKKVRTMVAEVASKHGRKSPPEVLAVSKTKPAEMVKEVYEAGQRHFGENYVQEILEKAPQLPSDIQWHMIGHLQSNKCKSLLEIPNLYVIESVDSQKLADKIQNAASSMDRTVRVMLEVKTSDEDTKSGLSLETAPDLAAHILKSCPNLIFCGLMTIAHPDPEKAEANFRDLSALRDRLSDELGLPKEGEGSLELSMGMSGDLEQAIAAGSSQVRIGTAIFGAREYRNMKEKRVLDAQTPAEAVAQNGGVEPPQSKPEGG
uniref:Pyridoxal phosphate homeostasis protein n=1 Tax=Chromera velia CCMP2878 TaxID=1169474 RepID=A0A0G4IB72_9ALVE|eukprot:Cvel_12775.t1-p1 / transcript=Cvel_12775.t1 / gene=Cvel_12775 / organism=Chromera_velia_CCMP2878 / gene_product=Proline synthase co-transcribed bacterial homolog, putative / transcript_product=Proline synthase co-transcribed bacterial homolog, putative / location=Cvel_scaffold850:19829-20776(+) / protein_length=316 / sequence_SO=supercontig / SO=protein_coding / is_pseudo=false